MHYYSQLLNITDQLSLIFVVLGLLVSSVAILITVKALDLAYFALNQWKKEKEWDIINEANAKVFTTFYNVYSLKLLLPSRFMQFLHHINGDFRNIASRYLQYIANDELNLEDLISDIATIHEKLKNVNAHKKTGPDANLFEFYDLAFAIITDSKKLRMQDYINVIELSTKENSQAYVDNEFAKSEMLKKLKEMNEKVPEEMEKNIERLKSLFITFEKKYDLEYIKKSP